MQTACDRSTSTSYLSTHAPRKLVEQPRAYYRVSRKSLVVRQDFKLGAVSTGRTVQISAAPPVDLAPRPSQQVPFAPIAIGCMVVAGFAFAAWRQISNRGSVQADSFVKDIMRNVNTVQMEMLSDDQIDAARQRRSKERANTRLTMDDIELPENHPFATKNPVSKEDDDLIRARLQVRRRRPLAPAPEDLDAPENGSGGGGNVKPMQRIRRMESRTNPNRQQ